jgi:hypothetical protein
MKRRHLIEIEDQSWCPRAVRDGLTDYLQFILGATNTYGAAKPIISRSLQRLGTARVVDLCSGAGGPWPSLQADLAKAGLSISVCLTDRYPNLQALQGSKGVAQRTIIYYPEPVDATQVPSELTGFRTMFTAFHHFHPEHAAAVLADAVSKRQGIGIFEGTERSLLALVLMLFTPVMMLVVTPLIRPFRWSRFLWTYVVPVVPAVVLFDGMVSCLRSYNAEELQALTASLDAKDYHWEIGKVKSDTSLIPITYLIGMPIGSGNAANSG